MPHRGIVEKRFVPYCCPMASFCAIYDCLTVASDSTPIGLLRCLIIPRFSNTVQVMIFSRADENYFSGAMRYVKEGNTEIVCNLMKEMLPADTFKIEMKNPYRRCT